MKSESEFIIFIQENAFENVICQSSSHFVRGRWVNSLWPCDIIWRPRSWWILCSGNGLLPDGTKPLTEPLLTYHQRFFCGIHLIEISQEILLNIICNMCLEITLKKLLPHLPGPMSSCNLHLSCNLLTWNLWKNMNAALSVIWFDCCEGFCFVIQAICFTCTTLTHWGRDKMTAISQTTLSNAFSWMKMLQLGLKFHWNLFPRVQLTIFQHWFR